MTTLRFVLSAWTEHKPECLHLKSLENGLIVPDAARIISKIVRKLKNGGDMQRSYYSEHGFRKFRDLMSRTSYHCHDLFMF